MTAIITIDTFTIKQDTHGRFCLNDLHKASGGEKKYQPALFMRLDSTAELIKELSNSTDVQSYPPIKINSGRYGGTFVCKELVYAYAMWISAAFQLKVIRAFDTLQTQGVAVAEHAAEDLLKNPLKYLEAIIGQAKELQAQLAIAAPKAEVFDAIMEERNPTLAKFARSLKGVNTIATKRDLKELGYLYKAKGIYRVYAKHRGVLFDEKMNPNYGSYDIFVLPDGAKELTKLFKEKKLTMLKTK